MDGIIEIVQLTGESGALVVLVLGMNFTILSIGLPTLTGTLKASGMDLHWFSSVLRLRASVSEWRTVR